METRNDKGGSTGSGNAKGSSNNDEPGKMPAGQTPSTGSTTRNTGTSGTGSTGAARGTSGMGDSENFKGSSGTASTGATGRNKASTGTSRSKKSNSEDGKDMLSDLGVNKNQVLTALGVVAGGALLYKGAKALAGSGKSAAPDKKAIINISTSTTVKRPKEELYAYWRNLENLPNFMSHIEDVREVSDKRSQWTAEVPGGLGTIEWDAEIIWEQKNHSIAWKSLPDSEIENSGEVRFQDAGNGKSTIVESRISYRPPAGQAGGLAAKLLNPAFKKVVESDLKEFKKVMEKEGATKRASKRA